MSTPSYSLSESPFLDRVRRTIRLKHMSCRTEKSYFYYILDYIITMLPEQLIEPLKQQLNYAKLLYALDLAEELIDDYLY